MKSNAGKKRIVGMVVAVVVAFAAIVGYVAWKKNALLDDLQQKSLKAVADAERLSEQTLAEAEGIDASENDADHDANQTDDGASSKDISKADSQSAADGIDWSVDDKGLSRATVVLNTTRGKIKYKFYSNDAPNTSRRIAELIQKGFYNGLTFHRVVPGFVVQGGDPDGNGTGGSGKKLKAEFNSRKHVPGTVAMARSQDPNSTNSQFYISLGTHAHLDNSYTVFGFVTEGMHVAEQIQVGDRMTQVTIE